MSAFRSFVFISLAFGLFWAYAKNKITPKYFVIGMVLSIGLDVFLVDKNYLNEDQLVKRKGRDSFYQDTPADQLILQDKDPNFRVFNLSANPFTDAMTSYHHKSVGGYHGAKLIRYQDMIDYHLSKNNIKVLDMLNTKYYIVRNNETGGLEVKGNPNALGNAWFINQIKWAENADAEIGLLNDFEPSKEVVIDQRFKEYVSSDQYMNDGSNTVSLSSYEPNHLIYDADVKGDKQFLVFSEIYYEGSDHDWKASIDGTPVEHIRVNYILRGMEVPKGQHTIEFKFEPISYYEGEKWSLIFSILVLLAVIGAVLIEIKKHYKKDALDQGTA